MSDVKSPAATSIDRQDPPASAVTPWLVLAVLLIINVPLFISMPLNNDVVLYDMQARNFLRGGVLYRDILEPNLPGIVWIHLLVRSVVGWSSEALRGVDLIFFSTTVWLATRWLKIVGRSTATQIWATNALFLFYFSILEWNHCQRDIWMLIPALAALHLRRLQTLRLATNDTRGLAIIGWSVLEGLCWAAAVWIKPHIVIPAAGVWVVSCLWVRRWQPLAIDLVTLIVTGSLIGAAGIGWLKATGAWPHFLDMMTNWNPRYLQAGKEHWEWKRLLALFLRNAPWHFLQPVAVVLAISTLLSRLRPSPSALRPPPSANPAQLANTLLVTFYLLWLAQVLLLQHQFDYVYVPTLVLAMMFLISKIEQPHWPSYRLWVLGFVLLALLCSPLRKLDRTAAWMKCISEGSTPAVRDRVRLENLPLFQSQQQVVEFLRQQQVQDREVLLHHDRLIPLYFEMDLQPPTRFVYNETIFAFFSDPKNPANDRRGLLYAGLKAAPLRFVVVDLASARNFKLKEALEPGTNDLHDPPPKLDTSIKNLFPWSCPIVFRSGPYLVYKVTTPLGKLRWDPPKKE